MPFSVTLSGRAPDTTYFVLSRSQPEQEHYVQAVISGTRFDGDISLGEKDEFPGTAEPVEVWAATGGAAATIKSYYAGPGERLPVQGFGDLSPAPLQIGGISVLRKPVEDC